MDRLFLDANVLFSAGYRDNAGLLQLWKLESAALCSSRYAVEEARFNLGEVAQRRRLDGPAARLTLFDAAQEQLPHRISLPEKDAPILLAAIEARATHLLTGDLRHFGPYLGKRIEGILVLTPGEYLREIARRR
jgi:predicted nucleic acid-binding protein